jgi:hypothetical protein
VAPTRNPARHAAPLPQVHEPPEATSLFVILIPIIAGQALHATRAPRAAHNPKFRSALLRRLFPHETLNRSRFPKLHSGPSNPAVTPLSVPEGLRSAVVGWKICVSAPELVSDLVLFHGAGADL